MVGLFLFLLSVDEVKIGYIDSQRVLQEYKGMAELQRQYQKEVEEWQRKAEEMRREILELQRELETQSVMLSEEAKARRMKEIEEKQKEYEEYLQEIWGPEGKAKKRNEEIMRPLIEKIQGILKTIGENEGFTVILDIASGAVVYAKEGLDLTERVIEELNREYAGTEEKVKGIKFFIGVFKNENAEAMGDNLGARVSQLISAALINAGFEKGKGQDFTSAKSAAGVSSEDELFDDEDKALSLVSASPETKILITGSVRKEGNRISIHYKIFDGDKRQKVKDDVVSSEGEEITVLQNLTNDIVSRISALYR